MSIGLRLGLWLGGGAAAAASSSLYVQTSSLAFVWDPETVAGADGATAPTWTDKISGYVATAPTGKEPVIKRSVLNGKSAVRFAGSKFYDIGRPTNMMSVLNADYTVMVVCTNLVAGAGANAAVFGTDSVNNGLWMTCNTANIGFYNTTTLTNPLTTTDLYVLFYNRRTSGTFPRILAGVNGTSYQPGASTGANAGTDLWAIGTSSHTANGSSGSGNSFRGDVLHIAGWNTNLSYVDMIRQTRKFFEAYGKALPWATKTRFMLCDGDSITQGVGAAVNQASYPFTSATNLGLKLGQWSNNGRTGAFMTQLADDYAFQYTGLSGADALGIPYVITWNEYANMSGQAAVITDTDRYAAQVKSIDPTAKSVFMNGLALGGTTGGDQNSDLSTSTQGTFRLAYNARYTTTAFPSIDYIFDIGADARMGVIGANPRSTTYPTLDWNDVKHPYGFAGQAATDGYARIAAQHSAIVGPLL